MRYLLCVFIVCSFISNTISQVVVEETAIVCDEFDDDCSQNLLENLYGCKVKYIGGNNPYVSDDIFIVDYAIFDAKAIAYGYKLNGFSNGMPIKLIKDSVKDETLVVIRFYNVSIVGYADFIFSVDQDFDRVIYADYFLSYEMLTLTAIIKGVETLEKCIDDLEVRTLSVSNKNVTFVVGQPVLEAAASDAVIANSLTQVSNKTAEFIKEELRAVSDIYFNAYLSGFSCPYWI